MNDMLAKRNAVRDALISQLTFFTEIPDDPYISIRMTADQRSFRGRLWFSRASYDAGEEPWIDLKGNEHTR